MREISLRVSNKEFFIIKVAHRAIEREKEKGERERNESFRLVGGGWCD